uniref:Uncharacterized protein n=1 Tax=Arundo donax TaxID=35708 RepID=A0A0A9AAB7_ARUDO
MRSLFMKDLYVRAGFSLKLVRVHRMMLFSIKAPKFESSEIALCAQLIE